MDKKKLAYYGGKKEVTFRHPHWKWPPQSSSKTKSIINYYKDGELKNEKGYPRIVESFEKSFAKYQNRKYALTTNSGTSSIQSAFFAINLKPGDEVIAPAMTFHATASPIHALNAVPVFADCDIETGNIDPKSIKKNITKKTAAIIINHLCGHPCEMNEILQIAKKNKIFLIEDCSHAHGSTYKGKKVGNFGDIGCFSLDNNKLLAAGEGGVLVTNNRKFYERAMLYSDFSSRIVYEVKNKSLKEFNETGLGFKHRIHPVSAAIAKNELKRIDFYIKKRHKILNYFSKAISKIAGISPPITKKYVNRGAFYGYRPFFRSAELNNVSITKFIKLLQAEGVEVRQSNNQPLHLLPLFASKKFGPKILNKKITNYREYKKGDLPNSEKFFNTTLSLPTFTFESKKLIDQYIKAFKKVCYFLSKSKKNI